tara:strand:+ start:75409 stop:76062 length:654 start_codon:yes stop_codon:yes gene_type:complete
MKHLFLIPVILFSFWTSSAQESVQGPATDVILHQEVNPKTKTSLSMRCGASIADFKPLFMVDGKILSNDSLSTIHSVNMADLNVLKENSDLTIYGDAGKNGVVLITTKDAEELVHHKNYENLPFKIYDVPTANLNLPQDFYNRIISYVPGVQISNIDSNLDNTPTLTIRGDRNTLYIIDGIRYYDARILNAINPNDIESIKVATDVAASNYVLTNPN